MRILFHRQTIWERDLPMQIGKEYFLRQICIMKPNRNITQCLDTLFSPMILSRNCSQAYETLTLLSKSMITAIHLCSSDFFFYLSFNHLFNTQLQKNALHIMWKTFVMIILPPSLKIKEVHANFVHICQKTIGTLLPRQLLNWSREGHPPGSLAELIFLASPKLLMRLKLRM